MLQIVPRNDWAPAAPKWTEPLFNPVSYVFCTYTRKASCFGRERCTQELLYLYNKQMKYGDKPDITYNFYIGGDGTVYEGRGWTSAPSLPRRYAKLMDQCIAIAMLGTFNYAPPSDEMKKKQRELIKFGMDHDYIKKSITQFTT